MDAWTTLEHIDLTTVATSEAELSAVVTESGGRTRNQKRKIEDVHEEEEHHGEFDQNALREHEEFTKVKNVERIELGRYEMETWYFSPLPQEYNMCKVRPLADSSGNKYAFGFTYASIVFSGIRSGVPGGECPRKDGCFAYQHSAANSLHSVCAKQVRSQVLCRQKCM